MHPTLANVPYVRNVSGEIVSLVIVQTSVGRVEIFRRQNGKNAIDWHFCQPEMTLFWHRSGYSRMYGEIDGARVDRKFVGNANLSIIAPNTEIRTSFEASDFSDYVAVFFEEKALSALDLDFCRSKLTFSNELIQNGLHELCEQAENPDTLFSLFADGWTRQALSIIGRLLTTSTEGDSALGGLPKFLLRRVEMYVQDHLADELTVDDLATLVGLSKRHFTRALVESLNITPHRYVLSRRIEAAKIRLRSSTDSITSVAIDLGFRQMQHFSTAFRKFTGYTPSEYRRRYISGSLIEQHQCSPFYSSVSSSNLDIR